jgi:hypothetical protein
MLVRPIFRKPEPLIMQLDCSNVNCFQVSPGDISSSTMTDSFESSDEESVCEATYDSIVYVIKESGAQTYPQAKKRKPLPRCNSWSFNLV